MSDWNTLKKKEQEQLLVEYEKDPSLFNRQTNVEDEALLRKFGIIIPKKNSLPRGFIKFSSSDFIVEEVNNNGEVIEAIFANNENPGAVAPPYTVYATLVKCGVSTLDVIEDIVRRLKIERKQIQYAGIKDRDAITAQKISFRGLSYEKIRSISSPNYRLQNISLGKGVIEKSAIRGNKFTILVRVEKEFFIREKAEHFVKQLEEVTRDGFNNYFYLQRFGSPRFLNYKWAYMILQGKYKEAVEHVFFAEGSFESGFFLSVRKKAAAKKGNWKEVLDFFEPYPIILQNEIAILRHLIDHPNQYAEALGKIPDQITLWVYAFGSWLWNRSLAGFVSSENKVPTHIPLFLSQYKEDVDFYKEDLTTLKIFPPNFSNLRPFPSIRLEHREVPTKESVKMHAIEIVPEGVILSFTLGKGDYATTFLSHLFNLVSGQPPKSIQTTSINIKEKLSISGFAPVLEYFKPVISDKSLNMFQGMKKEKANLG